MNTLQNLFTTISNVHMQFSNAVKENRLFELPTQQSTCEDNG